MSGIRDIWLLANNIIRSSRQLINEDLKPLGLSSAEGNILLQLLMAGDRDCRQDEIVEQLDVSKPAISRAIDSLESKGYITRSRHPDDRRVSQIRMTDRAREIGPAIERVYNEVFAIATEVVSEREAEDFIALFARVSDSFSRARTDRKNRGGS